MGEGLVAARRISARSADDRLRAADLRAILDLTQRVSAAANPDEFADLATRGLYRLVGCDFASFNEVNMHSRSGAAAIALSASPSPGYVGVEEIVSSP